MAETLVSVNRFYRFINNKDLVIIVFGDRFHLFILIIESIG